MMAECPTCKKTSDCDLEEEVNAITRYGEIIIPARLVLRCTQCRIPFYVKVPDENAVREEH